MSSHLIPKDQINETISDDIVYALVRIKSARDAVRCVYSDAGVSVEMLRQAIGHAEDALRSLIRAEALQCALYEFEQDERP